MRPAAQRVQDAVPSEPANEPWEQLWHLSLPVKLYFPAAQREQVTLSDAEKYPASQEVQELEALSRFVWEPAAHGRHASVSDTGAYLPDSQSLQTLVLKTYCPAEQLSHVLRSVEENLPASHAKQVSEAALEV